MKRLSILSLLALLALFAFGAAPSFAEVSRPMSAHPNSATLGSQCGAAGGEFNDYPASDGYPHTYNCSKSNCDGKGGTCTVSCGDKGCTGTTPSRIVNATLLMLLQNGSNVSHAPLLTEGPSGKGNQASPPAGGPTLPTEPSFL